MPIRTLFNQKNIIPTTLVILSIVMFFVPTDNATIFLIRSILSEILAGISAAIWIFRMPKTKVNEIYNYWIVTFPAVLALGILSIFYYFGFNKQEPIFVADMWFIVLATMGAILTMFFTEKRIKNLEKRTDSFEQRIDDLELKLNNANSDYCDKISEQNKRIEILNQIAWTRFELERAKAELHKQQSKQYDKKDKHRSKKFAA